MKSIVMFCLFCASSWLCCCYYFCLGFDSMFVGEKFIIYFVGFLLLVSLLFEHFVEFFLNVMWWNFIFRKIIPVGVLWRWFWIFIRFVDNPSDFKDYKFVSSLLIFILFLWVWPVIFCFELEHCNLNKL